MCSPLGQNKRLLRRNRWQTYLALIYILNLDFRSALSWKEAGGQSVWGSFITRMLSTSIYKSVHRNCPDSLWLDIIACYYFVISSRFSFQGSLFL